MDKTNRTRKSQCQKDALWLLYKELKGKTPSREQIAELSNNLDLKENQVYKWFWDTKKKVEEDTQEAKKMAQDPRNLGDQNKKQKACLGVVGQDGLGDKLTPQQVKTALKIHQISVEKEADFESIAV